MNFEHRGAHMLNTSSRPASPAQDAPRPASSEPASRDPRASGTAASGTAASGTAASGGHPGRLLLPVVLSALFIAGLDIWAGNVCAPSLQPGPRVRGAGPRRSDGG